MCRKSSATPVQPKNRPNQGCLCYGSVRRYASLPNDLLGTWGSASRGAGQMLARIAKARAKHVAQLNVLQSQAQENCSVCNNIRARCKQNKIRYFSPCLLKSSNARKRTRHSLLQGVWYRCNLGMGPLPVNPQTDVVNHRRGYFTSLCRQGPRRTIHFDEACRAAGQKERPLPPPLQSYTASRSHRIHELQYRLEPASPGWQRLPDQDFHGLLVAACPA